MFREMDWFQVNATIDRRPKSVSPFFLRRNNLSFLRILKYYSRILFLTTNRVRAIDNAFRSRLHLTLYSPRPRKRQTKVIVQRTFQRITESNLAREKNDRSHLSIGIQNEKS
jgi:hypothetical protein